ncbi:MAG: DinB family protein [Acidobacteria bacterium]|nr:DinB family protein [Acidobacteriota bacterium]
MYQTDLELFHTVRIATLGLAAGLTDQQAAFPPGAGKWSIGEVLDHILLAEQLYRDRFTRLIELKKAGRKAELVSDFSEINTSVMFIPKPLLPALELPFKMMNLIVPVAVRETLTRHRLVPAQAPSLAEPRKGRPVAELREALQSSFAQTRKLFQDNPELNYREMRLSHPLMGNNNVLQLVRIMSLHEQRHQDQIRRVMASVAYPKSS